MPSATEFLTDSKPSATDFLNSGPSASDFLNSPENPNPPSEIDQISAEAAAAGGPSMAPVQQPGLWDLARGMTEIPAYSKQFDPQAHEAVKLFQNRMREQSTAFINLLGHFVHKRDAVPIYDKEGKLLDVRQETDQEYEDRLKRQKILTEHRLGPLPDKGTALDIAGSMANTIMDPVNYVFMTGIPKTTLLRLGVLAVEGAGAEAAIESGQQYKDFGKIKDPDALITRTVIGGLSVPALDLTVRAGIAMTRGMTRTAARGKLAQVERLYRGYKKAGYNNMAAYRKSLYDARLIDDDLYVLHEKAGRKVNFKYAPNPKDLNPGALRKLYDWGMGKANTLGAGMDDMLGNLSRSIGKVDPELRAHMLKMEYAISRNIHLANTNIQGWKDQLAKLPQAQRMELGKYLYNSDYKNINKFMAGRTELRREYDHLQKFLNGFYKQLTESNMYRKEELDYVKNFYPRVISDMDGLAKKLGTNKFKMLAAIRSREAQLGRDLTAWEKSQVVNNFLRRAEIKGAPTGEISPEKSRVLNKIPDELMPYYADPIAAVERYIHTVTNALAKRDYFGISAMENRSLEQSVGDILAPKIESGDITEKDAVRLQKLLMARFGGGEMSGAGALIDTKNMFYIGTLNDITNGLTQLGDLFVGMQVNSLRPTLIGMVRTLTGASHASRVDIGLKRIAEEFATTRTTSKMVNGLFKYMTGFEQMDALGKNVAINAAFEDFFKKAATKSGVRALKYEFNPAFGSDMERVLTDLRNQRVTEDTLYMAFTRLSRTQPISKSEMPVMYLNHPNGRIFYMLKTFMLKQLNLMREDGIDQIRKGNIVYGTQQLAKYAMYILAGNSGVQKAKAMLAGEDYDMSDHLASNIFKNFGLSGYLLRRSKAELSYGITQLMMPPLSILDPAARMAVGEQTWGETFANKRTWDVIPEGKMLYRWLSHAGVLETQREVKRHMARRQREHQKRSRH